MRQTKLPTPRGMRCSTPGRTQAFVTPTNEGTVRPQWMTAKIGDENTVKMSEAFAGALAKIKPHLDEMPDMGTLEIAAIRVLLVHSWRRIVLKTPAFPDHVFPDEWPGLVCRAEVSELLTRYPKRRDDLEAAIAAVPRQLSATIATPARAKSQGVAKPDSQTAVRDAVNPDDTLHQPSTVVLNVTAGTARLTGRWKS